MKKRWIVILFCIFSLFAWAIWNAFLTDIVPRHRTLFWSYDSFRDKADRSQLALQLPKSAQDIKYYWSVDWFVYVAGYGTTLSDEDYEEMKEETIERYQINYESTEYFSGETLYISSTNSEHSEKDWILEEWLVEYGIEEAEGLLLKGENLENYYILVYDYIDNGDSTYLNCMLCNDSTKRVIEMNRRNMNVLPKGD